MMFSLLPAWDRVDQILDAPEKRTVIDGTEGKRLKVAKVDMATGLEIGMEI